MQGEEIENLQLTLERLVSESPEKDKRLRRATILRDTRVSKFNQMEQIDSNSEIEDDWRG